MIQKLRGTNQKGFTLIELMIVIAIIGILAAIAIPNFIAYRDKAFCSYAEQDAQSVSAAMASYFSEPDHTQTPNVEELIATEQLSVNNSTGSIDITEDTTQRDDLYRSHRRFRSLPQRQYVHQNHGWYARVLAIVNTSEIISHEKRGDIYPPFLS